jgi:hypothetical protein
LHASRSHASVHSDELAMEASSSLACRLEFFS